jgi:hypothetical protein
VKQTDEALACDFSAIPEDERDTHRSVAKKLFYSVEDVEELSDGYMFRLSENSKSVERAGTFVARERMCCPFFRFELTIETEGGPISLKLTGSDRVKTFIEETVLREWDL